VCATRAHAAHTHTCSPQQHNPGEEPGTTPLSARYNASSECPGQRLRGVLPRGVVPGTHECARYDASAVCRVRRLPRGHGWRKARTLEQSSVASTAAHAAAARPFPDVEQT
jgi:hypothetical protein